MARPTVFSDTIAEYICDQLAIGRSLISICDEEPMPSRSTVNRWIREKPDFGTNIARAREDQADYYLDRQVEYAELATIDDYLLRKFQADNLKWVASKLAPKKYGDRLTADIGNKDDKPFEVTDVSKVEKGRAIAWVLAEANRVLKEQKENSDADL